jgi:YVTN family beta-propeller protein
MKKIIITLFLVFIIIAGCTRDELIPPVPPVVQTITGGYILSEGGFSAGTSKLSYYDIVKDTFYLNIFYPGNIGLFSSGMIYYNKNLFITEQGNYGSPGKIYRLDSSGNVLSNSVIGTNPYSLAVSNNKIYVTNGPAGYVGVYDVNSFSLSKTINVGVYPQEIISNNNKIFVCNTSLFGGNQDSTVTVIDPFGDSVINTLRLKKDPSGITSLDNNNILVGCNGIPGKIFKINTTTLIATDTFTVNDGFDRDIAVDESSSNIYFISLNNNIVKINLNTKTETIFVQNLNPTLAHFYGYNYDSKNKKHYIADARNFSSPGYLLIVNSDGTLSKTFSSGVAPRRIVFKGN